MCSKLLLFTMYNNIFIGLMVLRLDWVCISSRSFDCNITVKWGMRFTWFVCVNSFECLFLPPLCAGKSRALRLLHHYDIQIVRRSPLGVISFLYFYINSIGEEDFALSLSATRVS